MQKCGVRKDLPRQGQDGGAKEPYQGLRSISQEMDRPGVGFPDDRPLAGGSKELKGRLRTFNFYRCESLRKTSWMCSGWRECYRHALLDPCVF